MVEEDICMMIIGEINGSDWSVIRYMAGRDYYGSESDGIFATDN